MTVYVCLDDRNGMRFNNRRQSRDRAVLEDIRAAIPKVLTVDSCSEALVQEAGIPYTLIDGEIPEDAHFFLEAGDVSCIVSNASALVIYRWNRHYPADVRFDADLSGFTLESTTEFPGKSHDRITKEVYLR